MANARRAVAPAVTAVIAAAAARAAYTALTRNPPGGAERWTRTNHRGEPVTLLEGPAAAIAGAIAAAAAPGFRPGPGRRWWPRRPEPPRSAVTTTSPDRGTGAGSAATSAPWRTARSRPGR